MTIEARKPPPQFAFRLKRALGGRAGWTGFALQILFVALLVWIGYEIVANARANLEAQRITSGFGFLNNTAGVYSSPKPFPSFRSSPYNPLFPPGFVNTPLGSFPTLLFSSPLRLFLSPR